MAPHKPEDAVVVVVPEALRARVRDHAGASQPAAAIDVRLTAIAEKGATAAAAKSLSTCRATITVSLHSSLTPDRSTLEHWPPQVRRSRRGC